MLDGYETLVQARKDVAWRIGAAAREDDNGAVEIFVNLVNAIDATLAFHDQRALGLVGEGPVSATT